MEHGEPPFGAAYGSKPSVAVANDDGCENETLSTLGAGDFAATQGRANWVSGPKGSDAAQVRRRWRIARELLNEDV